MTGNSHHYNLSPVWLPSVMHPADNGRAVDAYPDLQQKDTYRVDRQPTVGVKNGVDCHAQTLVVNDLKSRRWPAASAVPQGLVLDTTVLSLTHLGGGLEHTQLCR